MEPAITRMKIAEAVSSYTGVSVKRMACKCREQDILFSRHLALYIMYNYVPRTTLKHSAKFFDQHHTTVMNAIKHVQDRLYIRSVKYLMAIDTITSHLGLEYVPKSKDLIIQNADLKAEVIRLRSEIFQLKNRTA